MLHPALLRSTTECAAAHTHRSQPQPRPAAGWPRRRRAASVQHGAAAARAGVRGTAQAGRNGARPASDTADGAEHTGCWEPPATAQPCSPAGCGRGRALCSGGVREAEARLPAPFERPTRSQRPRCRAGGGTATGPDATHLPSSHGPSRARRASQRTQGGNMRTPVGASTRAAPRRAPRLAGSVTQELTRASRGPGRDTAPRSSAPESRVPTSQQARPSRHVSAGVLALL
jgi:hypothetical protein